MSLSAHAPPFNSPTIVEDHLLKDWSVVDNPYSRAPPPTELEHSESSASSMVDVDSPHISSVASDYVSHICHLQTMTNPNIKDRWRRRNNPQSRRIRRRNLASSRRDKAYRQAEIRRSLQGRLQELRQGQESYLQEIGPGKGEGIESRG